MQEKIPSAGASRGVWGHVAFPGAPTFSLPQSLHVGRGRGVSLVSCPFKSCVFFLSNFEKQAGEAG